MLNTFTPGPADTSGTPETSPADTSGTPQTRVFFIFVIFNFRHLLHLPENLPVTFDPITV